MIDRAIISGGGTGGHIFPAIAIADEIKRRNPKAEILFVGAMGKMEMEKVPVAGYKIEGLNIAGFQREFTWSNFLLPFKIIGSVIAARKIIKEFNPQVVVGVGGYASGPTLQAATALGYPTLVQEQNSFPGKTNKILAKKVNTLCTAFEGLEKFFPKDKIVLTGNPVRSNMVEIEGKRKEAFEFFQLDPSKKTILIVGGSLGAKTLNDSVKNNLNLLSDEGVQVLWQCGKYYYETLWQEFSNQLPHEIKLVQFIERMDLAYAMADVVISRAGAIAVSELCLVRKPVVLVPSPNVAEDHQTKNAMALVQKGAAVLVKDVEARQTIFIEALKIIKNEAMQKSLIEAITPFGKPHATADIVNELEKIKR
jgi:UDP-N-acetylglucosamine--N-acetylmuramyl-(pentapeptide) pyrophosphoryl-undecaprenol N-acetylglucosamine transferase